MKSLTLKQVNLNNWANKIIRDALSQNISSEELTISTPYGTILDVILHMIKTINHWLDFFDDYFSFPKSDDDFDFSDFLDILKFWELTDKRLEDVIEAFEENELEDSFTYSHDNVEQYKMKFCDLFLHLTCHSYYHRGQLATLFRQLGLAPLPPTDADDYFKIQIS